jgi:hypothetical protein
MGLRKRGLVQGVGVNDVQEPTAVFREVNGVIRRHIYTVYGTWCEMLKRAYCPKYKALHPTYEGVTVCEDWLRFSNFKAWMEQQDWQGKQLDKDLLVEGNKIYSPEFCVFIKGGVNKFMTQRDLHRGSSPLGVHWDKAAKMYVAQCNNPFTKKRVRIGVYLTEEEAHQAWKKRKHEHALALAALETDPRIIEALSTRYL